MKRECTEVIDREGIDADAPVTVQIVEALAAHFDTEPTALEFSLADVVDPDALEALLESDADDLAVSFTVRGSAVTVTGDGTLLLSDRDDAAD